MSDLEHLPMIERIATVIANGVGADLPSDEIARAVLTEMREPTVGMILSCADLPDSQQAYWHRSIDAALHRDFP